MSLESDITRVREILRKADPSVKTACAIKAWDNYRADEPTKYYPNTSHLETIEGIYTQIEQLDKETTAQTDFRIRAIRPLCVDSAYTTIFIGDFTLRRPTYHISLLKGYQIIDEATPKDNQSVAIYQPRILRSRSRS